MEATIDTGTIFSTLSFLVTMYFWFVQARKELPSLEFHQLSGFRAVCRKQQGLEGKRRLCITQVDTGGVLIVNHSIRQNSIVMFDCVLHTEQGTLHGDWGYTGDDRPPWNIGPESTIAFSPAAFFEVPEDYEPPDDLEFELRFVTASGKNFRHRFTREAPRLRANETPQRQAA